MTALQKIRFQRSSKPGRGLIFGSCFLLSVSLVVVLLTTQVSKHAYDDPVIIIGAGASGISAGATLFKHGIDFTILEALPSIGGRMKHVEWEGLTIELGANWIHGDVSNFVLWPYRESLDIKGHITNYSDVLLVDNNEAQGVRKEYSHLNGTYWSERIEEAMGECEDRSDALWKEAKKSNWKKGVDDLDESLQYCLRQDMYYNKTSSQDHYFGESFSRLANLYRWLMVDFEYAEEPQEVSVMWAFPENGPMADVDYLVTDRRGYNQILKNISEPFKHKILRNHSVKEVLWSEKGNVTLVTDGHGKFHAPKVISTCSLGVMKGSIANDPNSKVRFIPELPQDMQEGINQVVMGHYSKIFAKFSHNFWGDSETLMLARSETGLLPWAINLDHPTLFPGSNVLSFHVSDAYAGMFERQSHNETAKALVEALELLLGVSNVPNPTSVLVSSWIDDPYTNGSYSDVPKGVREETYNAMSKALGNRLFFAGEHLDDVYYGYVHGAILNGEKVAKDVINSRKNLQLFTPLVVVLLILWLLMTMLVIREVYQMVFNPVSKEDQEMMDRVKSRKAVLKKKYKQEEEEEDDDDDDESSSSLNEEGKQVTNQLHRER